MRAQDPEHWLYRHTPREWLRAALGELEQAKRAYAAHNGRAGLAGCRRAAGVALNGWLATLDAVPDAYGRSYMDHLAGLIDDTGAPEAAHAAARVLRQTPLPGGDLVALRTPTTDGTALDAAETVMAHAYAGVVRSEADEP